MQNTYIKYALKMNEVINKINTNFKIKNYYG